MRLRSYHETTKHSIDSVRASPRTLDFANQPVPFRRYRGLDVTPLPRRLEPGEASAGSAILSGGDRRRSGEPPDRGDLGRLLHYSMGIVRSRTLADGRRLDFRAAPCTGALYHLDAWLVCADLPDLPAGVYHFAPDDFGLRRLREGDLRGVLLDASGDAPDVGDAPVILVFASHWWRNAWKYRDRAYRHVFWDAGTILAQLVAAAEADGWPVGLVCGFADDPVERLLGLDPEREGAVALVAIGTGRPAPFAGPHEAISPATAPTSSREENQPIIRDAHRASSLASGDVARAWRGSFQSGPALKASEGRRVPLPSVSIEGREPLQEAIRRRGSTREFGRAPISPQALATLIACARAPLAADYREREATLFESYVIVNGVDDIPPGAYRWDPVTWSLVELEVGDFRETVGRLALGQALAADAAVNHFAIVDLEGVLAAGDRGYRAAQLDAGIAGGRIYLAAYAAGLGATGLTFFDDDVCRFLGLDASRYGVMFLTAVGLPQRGRAR